MAQLNNIISRKLNFIFDELSDPRTKDWLLIKSPYPGLSILALYLFFVNKWGPKYMENKKPYKLKTLLIVYNFLQVLVSTWISVQGLSLWLTYNWRCQPVDFSNSPDALSAAQTCHLYFMAKMTELLDTVFFVLRKKHNQITFLHVYHHTVMPMISWGATKYFPGGHGTFIAVINSIVHIFMYSYYLVASIGPDVQKIIWWKKYITYIQMVQFCLTFLHSSQLLFYDCGYPRWTVVFLLPNSLFFFYLFSDFYIKTYKMKNNTLTENNSGAKNNKLE